MQAIMPHQPWKSVGGGGEDSDALKKAESISQMRGRSILGMTDLYDNQANKTKKTWSQMGVLNPHTPPAYAPAWWYVKR